jgi:hypothetical protein
MIKERFEKKMISVLKGLKDSWIQKKEFVDTDKKVYKQRNKIFIKDLSDVEVKKLKEQRRKKIRGT